MASLRAAPVKQRHPSGRGARSKCTRKKYGCDLHRTSAFIGRVLQQLGRDIVTNGGKSTEDRIEEQYRVQQEVLKARQNRSSINQAQERRRKVSQYLRSPKAQQKAKEAKRQKLREQTPYPDEQAEGAFSLGGIIVPLPPFGFKEYDDVDSERFDLSGPYAEEGYVDEDADVMARLRKAFTGGGKKVKEKKQRKKRQKFT